MKVFDARTKSSVMTIEHGHPVESVLLFPSGGLLVSAGTFILFLLLHEGSYVPVAYKSFL